MGLVTRAQWQRHSSVCHKHRHTQSTTLLTLTWSMCFSSGYSSFITKLVWKQVGTLSNNYLLWREKREMPRPERWSLQISGAYQVSAKPVPPAVRWSVAHSVLLSCPRWHRCGLRTQLLKDIVQQLHCATHPTQGKEIASTQLKKVSCLNNYPWQNK